MPEDTQQEKKPPSGGRLWAALGLSLTAVLLLALLAPASPVPRLDLPGGGRLLFLAATPGKSIRAVASTPAGVVLGLAGEGARVVGPDGKAILSKDLPENVAVLAPMSLGLWAGTHGGGLHLITGAGMAERQTLPSPEPRVVTALVQGGGRLWAATERGVYAFDGDKWTAKGRPDEATTSTLTSLLFEPGRGLWVGTDRGLFLLGEGGFAHHPLPGLPGAGVLALALAPSGSVLCASSSGLLLLEPKGWHQLGAATARAFLVTGEGAWIGTSRGLLRLRGTKAQKVKGFPALSITAMAVQGRALLLGTRGGLYRYEP